MTVDVFELLFIELTWRRYVMNPEIVNARSEILCAKNFSVACHASWSRLIHTRLKPGVNESYIQSRGALSEIQAQSQTNLAWSHRARGHQKGIEEGLARGL